MNDHTCRIRMCRGDVELEIEGDKDFVLQALAEFRGKAFNVFVEHPLELQEYPAVEGTQSEAAPEAVPSAQAFLRSVSPQTVSDKVLAFAAYYFRYKGVTAFTRSDVERWFEDSMEKRPTNTSDSINVNRKKGYFDLAKRDKSGPMTFRLTNDGLSYIEGK